MNISKLIQHQNERFLYKFSPRYMPTKNETRLFIQNISAYKSSFHVKLVIAISIFFVVLCKLDISSKRETLFNDIQSWVKPHELISYNATCDFKLKKTFHIFIFVDHCKEYWYKSDTTEIIPGHSLWNVRYNYPLMNRVAARTRKCHFPYRRFRILLKLSPTAEIW